MANMNIGELIHSYNSLTKHAFIANPQVQQQQDQQGQQPGAAQGGAPTGPEQGGDPSQQLFQQVLQLVQSAPPELQQQLAPQLEQIQQLPPEQQTQALTSLASSLSGSGGGVQPQGQGGQPGDPNAATGAGGGEQVPTEGHVNAENNLDNTQVTLTVRELMDLTSGGKATQSLLKVKQLADTHNQKMQQSKQQQQIDQQQAEQQAAVQQQGAQGGGIYQGGPMDGSAPPTAP